MNGQGRISALSTIVEYLLQAVVHFLAKTLMIIVVAAVYSNFVQPCAFKSFLMQIMHQTLAEGKN